MESKDPREIDQMIADRFPSFHADGDWQPDMQRGLSLLRDRRAATSGRRRRWAWVAAAAVAASVPIMAFPVTRALAQRCVTACVEQTAVVRQLLLGSATPAPSSTFVMPEARKMAPDFTLSDGLGKPVRLSDFRGKVVLLNFWATWCPPCEKEIPWFIEFQRANESRGFAVLGVSMDRDGWPLVGPWIARKGVNYPVMLGNSEVAALFGGLQSIPLTVIVDRSGRIAAIHAGFCRKDEYESDLQVVLDER
jgi:cytochrome c biogenesis protein CcmG/thiol:disulfide interchange protein DsbE